MAKNSEQNKTEEDVLDDYVEDEEEEENEESEESDEQEEEKTQEDEIAELKREIRKLSDVVDQNRIKRWEKENQGEQPTKVMVSTFRGDVIVKWETIHNEVWRDQDKGWKEKQVIKVTFDSGDTKELSYNEFATKVEKIDAEIVSKEEDKDSGDDILTVRTQDGEEYEINSIFIN